MPISYLAGVDVENGGLHVQRSQNKWQGEAGSFFQRLLLTALLVMLTLQSWQDALTKFLVCCYA
jgi:hypothetical protein